ncbi:hypothetical protein LQR30_15690 [Chromobacterium piscinae]|uniref:hypothetical protein n=1 Tax=Chromobacterium piscinae TaxID=686831 RepID=UPI001E3324AC|nr:hypothetical protein [Chromobacterium piscinae]MCD4505541.1 hypothetical protein [Chromobacterium piscinae]
MKELHQFYGNSVANILDVTLSGRELRFLFCRKPYDVKVYLGLRAFALDGGEVVVRFGELANKVQRWLRYCEVTGDRLVMRNSLGESSAPRYADDKELDEVRKAMKRLEADGLIVVGRREGVDGRLSAFCAFPMREMENEPAGNEYP